MIADTEDELHNMADHIRVARRWYQGDHYDICMSKRKAAIAAGAVEITWKQCACMSARQRALGELGSPKEAVKWYSRLVRIRMIKLRIRRWREKNEAEVDQSRGCG